MTKELEAKIVEIIDRETYIDERSDNEFGYEIHIHYDEELSDNQLAKISRSDNPREEADEHFEEWRFNSENWYWGELYKTITSELENEEIEYDDDELCDWINDHVYWYLPEKVWNQDVDVVVALDTGDANSDFTECNILNWYGTSGGYNPDGELSDVSPIRYIAETQGKLDEVERMIDYERGDVYRYYNQNFSKFTKSICQELYNGSSHMLSFVFLLQMTLKDFCTLREQMKEKKGSIQIDPKTMCGLYDIWGGGGSVLEVELEKEINLPVDKIWEAWIDCRGCNANGHGYGVYDVYGFNSKPYTYGDYKLIA